MPPNSKVTQQNRALRGATKSFECAIANDKDVVSQLTSTRVPVSESESESEFIKSVNSYKITPTIKITKYNIKIDKSDDTNVKILR